MHLPRRRAPVGSEPNRRVRTRQGRAPEGNPQTGGQSLFPSSAGLVITRPTDQRAPPNREARLSDSKCSSCQRGPHCRPFGPQALVSDLRMDIQPMWGRAIGPARRGSVTHRPCTLSCPSSTHLSMVWTEAEEHASMPAAARARRLPTSVARIVSNIKNDTPTAVGGTCCARDASLPQWPASKRSVVRLNPLARTPRLYHGRKLHKISRPGHAAGRLKGPAANAASGPPPMDVQSWFCDPRDSFDLTSRGYSCLHLTTWARRLRPPPPPPPRSASTAQRCQLAHVRGSTVSSSRLRAYRRRVVKHPRESPAAES